MNFATRSYNKAERSSPGTPPSLYDTSTSTNESYSSRGRRSHGSFKSSAQSDMQSHRLDTHRSSQHYDNMYPSQYYPQHQQTVLHSGPDTRLTRRVSGGSSTSRGIRATLSEPGVSTEFERYQKGKYASHQTSRPPAPASDIGALSMSEQIRQYNHQRFERPKSQSRSSYRPASPSPNRQRKAFQGDRLLPARESSFHASPLRSGASEQLRRRSIGGGNDSFRNHEKEPSRTSAKANRRSDPNASFGDTVGSPSTRSIQDLKGQPWENRKVLQVESYSGGEDISELRDYSSRRSRSARSLSPGLRHAHSYPENRSEVPKFNSKYYIAALAARTQANISKDSSLSSQSPLRRRIGQEESFTSATPHLPTDDHFENGISRRRSSSISRKPFDESPRSSTSNSKKFPATSSQRGRSTTSLSNSTNGRARDPSVESERRPLDRSMERQRPSTSSSSEARRGASLEPRGRTASTFIQQRVREFSREPKGRASDVSNLRSSSRSGARSHSQEPSRPRGNSESSVERLVREFSGGDAQKASTPPRASPALPHRSSYDQSNYSKDSPVSERRGNRLEDQSPSRDSYTKATNFWQEKVDSSPKPTTSEAPMTLLDRSEDHGTRANPTWSPEKAKARLSPMPTFDTKVDPGDKRNVSKLVAKLSAVSRDNPAEALAQIDSILRQEGNSNSAPFDETISSPLDSDDETSVSSITNPTYQEQAKPAGSSAPNSETRPPSPFGLSMSTSRRPRPSALPNYMPSSHQPDLVKRQASQDNPLKTKAMLRQEELEQYPLPLTTDFNDNSILASDEDVKFKNALKQDSKLLNDKTALSAKIRVWDDMSFGVSKGKSGDPQNVREESTAKRGNEGRSTRRPLLASARSQNVRSHPWDGEFPARSESVDVRDTSMANAMGIKASMSSPKLVGLQDTGSRFTKSRMESKTQATNFTGDTKGKPSKGNSTRDFPTDPIPFFSSQSPSTGWDVTPSMTPEQQRNTQKISADFDQAWAAMPGGEFFPEPDGPSPVQQKASVSFAGPNSERKKESKQKLGQFDLDESIHTASSSLALHAPIGASWKGDRLLDNSNEEHVAIEVSLWPGDQLEDSRGPAQSAKPKRRGFLRALIGKEKNKSSSNASNHESNHSVSMGSSGNRSVPSVTSSGSHPMAQVRTSPMPPGRGRSFHSNEHGQPQRSRSASTERFHRSSSMARKNGRVTRLYDQD